MYIYIYTYIYILCVHIIIHVYMYICGRLVAIHRSGCGILIALRRGSHQYIPRAQRLGHPTWAKVHETSAASLSLAAISKSFRGLSATPCTQLTALVNCPFAFSATTKRLGPDESNQGKHSRGIANNSRNHTQRMRVGHYRWAYSIIPLQLYKKPFYQ